jgi:hypothetical protein
MERIAANRGVVVEVIQPRAGDVYRYRLRFPDGTTAPFFRFELNDTRP